MGASRGSTTVRMAILNASASLAVTGSGSLGVRPAGGMDAVTCLSGRGYRDSNAITCISTSSVAYSAFAASRCTCHSSKRGRTANVSGVGRTDGASKGRENGRGPTAVSIFIRHLVTEISGQKGTHAANAGRVLAVMLASAGPTVARRRVSSTAPSNASCGAHSRQQR